MDTILIILFLIGRLGISTAFNILYLYRLAISFIIRVTSQSIFTIIISRSCEKKNSNLSYLNRFNLFILAYIFTILFLYKFLCSLITTRTLVISKILIVKIYYLIYEWEYTIPVCVHTTCILMLLCINHAAQQLF